MHDNYDLRQEQLNKASIMSSKTFLASLLDMFKMHVVGTQLNMQSFMAEHTVIHG